MGARPEITITGKPGWHDKEQKLKRQMREAGVEAGKEQQTETPTHDVSRDAFELADAKTLQRILEEAVESQRKYAAIQQKLEDELAKRRGEGAVPTIDLSQELGDSLNAGSAANTDTPSVERAA